VLLGAQWIMGGFHDVVLVVGAEQQKTMSSLDGSDVLGAAADYHNEKPEYGDFMFPKLFGRRFTSRNMARAKRTSPRSHGRITRTPN
jgi:acetyl-CoA acetyltransferase